jgi:HPt (histidine-containing phosphotransfer) domain-containing protein
MTDPRGPSGPIHSDLASDADMLEIIQMFVDEMPERVARLEEAWHESNIDSLARIAHQLKGASAGYGYSAVGDAAAALESSLKSADHDLSSVQSQFEELINLCTRVIV